MWKKFLKMGKEITKIRSEEKGSWRERNLKTKNNDDKKENARWKKRKRLIYIFSDEKDVEGEEIKNKKRKKEGK